MVIVQSCELQSNASPFAANTINKTNTQIPQATRRAGQTSKESCIPSNGCYRITQNDTVVVESKSSSSDVHSQHQNQQYNHIKVGPKIQATTTIAPKTNRTPKKLNTSQNDSNNNNNNNNGPQTTKTSDSVNSKRVDLSKFFREDVEDYPDDHISSVLSKTSDTIKKFFNLLNTPQDPHANLSERTKSDFDYDNSNNNNQQEGREEPICRSIPKTIVPRDAWLNDRRVFIANDREFMQVVQAEICANNGAECNHLDGVLPEGMSSICVQKYAYKRLLYLDSNSEKLSSDSFKYPSCCSCHIKFSHYDSRSINTVNPSSKQTENSDPMASLNSAQVTPSSASTQSTSTLATTFIFEDSQPANTLIINKRLNNTR